MKIDTLHWPGPDLDYDKTRTPGLFRAIALCDPHLSAYSPPVFKTDYWQLTKETLEKVLKFALEQNVDAILWAGDIFHLKSAQRNPTWFLTEVLQIFTQIEKHGIVNLGIAGNHDVKFGTVEAGLWGQPLDLLIKAGVYHLLDQNEVTFQITRHHQVRIAGASYFHGHAHTARDKKKRGAQSLITLGHFWFGPQSGEFFGEPIFGPDYLHAGETDLYVIGHHHEDQGLQQVGGKQYLSPGSMSRTGAHKHDLERRPAASLIEVSEKGIEVKILRPKVPLAEEVMDLEKREQVQQEQHEMNAFISAMSAVKIATTDPKAVLDELNPSTEVRTRVLEYLARAEA